jgi:hypothetical protein
MESTLTKKDGDRATYSHQTHFRIPVLLEIDIARYSPRGILQETGEVAVVVVVVAVVALEVEV